MAPGRFRMKAGGGAAGNNGIRSITAHIGDGFHIDRCTERGKKQNQHRCGAFADHIELAGHTCVPMFPSE